MTWYDMIWHDTTRSNVTKVLWQTYRGVRIAAWRVLSRSGNSWRIFCNKPGNRRARSVFILFASNARSTKRRSSEHSTKRSRTQEGEQGGKRPKRATEATAATCARKPWRGIWWWAVRHTRLMTKNYDVHAFMGKNTVPP